MEIFKALEESHDGVYKLRLRNESGVFESISKVEIEGAPGRKKALEQIKEEEVGILKIYSVYTLYIC